jgi:Uma2 family endonuclease
MTLATEQPKRPDLQVVPKPVTFDEFVDWYPENSTVRYELRHGVIIEMPKPKGKHSKISGKLAGKLDSTIERLELNYFIPKECLIKLPDDSGCEPDVIVLDEEALADEARWESGSIITKGSSVKLAIEVVSSNWQDDYENKMMAYEAIGIPEYWIVDYAGLGGHRHIGNPKQPTVTIATLIEGEYEITRFRNDELLISPAFPDLSLTAAQVMLL